MAKFLFVLILLVLAPYGRGKSLAILGDSSAKGGGAHPQIEFDSRFLFELITGKRKLEPQFRPALKSFGIHADPAAPLLLWRGPREFLSPASWVFFHFLSAVSTLFLSTEEYGWGYLLGRGLGYSAKDIWIAAEEGAKIDQLTRQIDRVLLHGEGQLPEKLIILFTQNDLCAGHPSLVTSSKNFGATLLRALKYALINAQTKSHSVDIYFAGFPSLTQMLTKESILNQKVKAFGEEVSCQNLRKRGYLPKDPQYYTKLPQESLYFSRFLPPNPVHNCPTLFALSTLAQNEISILDRFKNQNLESKLRTIENNMISDLASRIRNYRTEAEKSVQKAREWKLAHYPDKPIQFHYLKATENLEFEGEDWAADCFHLNLSGQAKMAKALLTEMKVRGGIQ